MAIGRQVGGHQAGAPLQCQAVLVNKAGKDNPQAIPCTCQTCMHTCTQPTDFTPPDTACTGVQHHPLPVRAHKLTRLDTKPGSTGTEAQGLHLTHIANAASSASSCSLCASTTTPPAKYGTICSPTAAAAVFHNTMSKNKMSRVCSYPTRNVGSNGHPLVACCSTRSTSAHHMRTLLTHSAACPKQVKCILAHCLIAAQPMPFPAPCHALHTSHPAMHIHALPHMRLAHVTSVHATSMIWVFHVSNTATQPCTPLHPAV